MELLRGFAFLHQPRRKFEHARPFVGWKFPVVHPQQKNVRKLQPFRSVHRHQLYGVRGSIIFQRDDSSRLFEIVEVLDKLRQAARVALWFPLLRKLREPRHIFIVLPARALGHFQPFEQIHQNLASGPPPHALAVLRKKLQQRREPRFRAVKRQLGLRRLQGVVERRAAPFRRALGQARQIFRLKIPRGRGKRSRAGNVVERPRDQPKIRQNVFHQRMVQDGKPADDKRNFPCGKLAHQFVPVRMLPVQNGAVHPAASRGMDALQLARYPARLFLFAGEFDHSNLLAFGARGAQELFRKVRADRILPDDLRGHAQDVWRRAVILHQGDAEFV